MILTIDAFVEKHAKNNQKVKYRAEELKMKLERGSKERGSKFRNLEIRGSKAYEEPEPNVNEEGQMVEHVQDGGA